MDTSSDKIDGIISWTAPKENHFWWRYNHKASPLTHFSHTFNLDSQQYPEWVGDTAGYWAEARILGGVLLFDQSTPNSNAAFDHQSRKEVA